MAIPRITEDTILMQCGAQSLERGERYYRNRHISDARRTGQTLKSSCSGSRGYSYYVEASFEKTKLAEARCDCPVGAGGHCKHVAALLLTWLHRPKSFVELPSMDELLNSQSKDDLIGLVRHLLRYDPDMEMLIHARLAAGDTSADPMIYQRQADMVFDRAERQGTTEFALSDQLSAIAAAGDELLAACDLTGAAAVFGGVATSIVHKVVDYQYFSEEGYVDDVVRDCVQGLAACLKDLGDNNTMRRAAIDALYSVYVVDMDALGGTGLSDDVPDILVTMATDDERQLLARKLRELLDLPSKAHDSWSREQHELFLRRLEDF